MVRFAVRLGYEGFSQLHDALRADVQAAFLAQTPEAKKTVHDDALDHTRKLYSAPLPLTPLVPQFATRQSTGIGDL